MSELYRESGLQIFVIWLRRRLRRLLDLLLRPTPQADLELVRFWTEQWRDGEDIAVADTGQPAAADDWGRREGLRGKGRARNHRPSPEAVTRAHRDEEVQ